ncbi:hypothetical protein D3C75_1212110 [compost metagenome]
MAFRLIAALAQARHGAQGDQRLDLLAGVVVLEQGLTVAGEVAIEVAVDALKGAIRKLCCNAAAGSHILSS